MTPSHPRPWTVGSGYDGADGFSWLVWDDAGELVASNLTEHDAKAIARSHEGRELVEELDEALAYFVGPGNETPTLLIRARAFLADEENP